jgi:hypothetical protein
VTGYGSSREKTVVAGYVPACPWWLAKRIREFRGPEVGLLTHEVEEIKIPLIVPEQVF